MKVKLKKKRYFLTAAAIFLAVAVSAALIITNIFIPVKYLSAYFTGADKNEEGVLRVSFLDVGYGDSTIVEFPDGKTMLIDGGDGSRPNNIKVLKELNARGIDYIDYLVCSSVSEERCGGLSEIVKYKTVGKVYSPYCPATYINSSFRAFSERLEKDGKEALICEYGGVFNEDYGYNFCFLSPSAHTLAGGEYDNLSAEPTRENVNSASAVMWIEYQGLGFLLAGNAPSSVLQNLFETHFGVFDFNGKTVDLSHCSVLKLSNHGASSGTYADAYKHISPQAAVLSVGENGYGYPSVYALSDCQNAVDENLYRTDIDGTVTVTVKNAVLSVKKEKV